MFENQQTQLRLVAMNSAGALLEAAAPAAAALKRTPASLAL